MPGGFLEDLSKLQYGRGLSDVAQQISLEESRRQLTKIGLSNLQKQAKQLQEGPQYLQEEYSPQIQTSQSILSQTNLPMKDVMDIINQEMNWNDQIIKAKQGAETTGKVLASVAPLLETMNNLQKNSTPPEGDPSDPAYQAQLAQYNRDQEILTAGHGILQSRLAMLQKLAESGQVSPQQAYQEVSGTQSDIMRQMETGSLTPFQTGELTARNKSVMIPTGETKKDPKTGALMEQVVPTNPYTNTPMGGPTWRIKSAGSQAGGNTPAVGDFNLTGDAFLNTIPAEYRLSTKKIANYELDPREFSAFRAGDRNALIKYALQYNPNFTPREYAIKARTRQEFTTGKTAANINFMNTAAGHLGQLDNAISALQNGDIQGLNAIANFYGTQTGLPAPQEFNAIKQAVAGELAKTFKGTGATDQEIANLDKTLAASLGPDVLRGVVKTDLELMRSKLEALQFQYQNAMGQPADFRILSPQAERIFNQLGVPSHDNVQSVSDPRLGPGLQLPDSTKTDTSKVYVPWLK